MNRVAVVTGGAGAIGAAIVRALEPTHTVEVLDRSAEPAVDLAMAGDHALRREPVREFRDLTTLLEKGRQTR